MIECEQYSRRESLVISGIPEDIDHNALEDKVLDILWTSGLNIRKDEISACHRLYKPRNSRYPARVVVRFVNRKVAQIMLSRRKQNQVEVKRVLGLNIRFYESLCCRNEEVLRLCNWLSDQGMIHNHYLRNGFVKIIVNEGDRPFKICHPNVIKTKFQIPDDYDQRRP